MNKALKDIADANVPVHKKTTRQFLMGVPFWCYPRR